MDDTLSRVMVWLPQFVVAAAVVIGFAGLAVWALTRLTGRSEIRGLEAVNAVLASTVLRRDRSETFGRLLESAVQHLGASSGAVHLGGEASDLELISAVGVQRLDLLVRLPAANDLAARAQVASVILETVGLYTPWAALSDGQPFILCAIGLHGPQARGLLVLCWPKRAQAKAGAPVLRQIGWYADQVLAEYAGLEQRARDLQALNDKLLWRDRLARTAAHDMRNKLAMPMEVLDSLEDMLAGDGADAVTHARRELRLLEAMLEDWVEPDRPLQPAPVAVEEIVSVAAAMMRVHGRAFVVDAPLSLPYVWGERESILRVIDNLLRNAIRYNADESRLQVWLRVRPAQGGMVLFEVGDSGRGISPEAQARLFEFGFRVEDSAGVPGHGLGLWSCRRLVQAHGGEIWVESAPGQGAKFFFTLPAATEARMEGWAEAQAGV